MNKDLDLDLSSVCIVIFRHTSRTVSSDDQSNLGRSLIAVPGHLSTS